MKKSVKELCNAIIVQAVKDYRRLSNMEERTPIQEKELKDTREFFTSEWFELLTDLDGNVILEKLEKEIKKQA